MRLALDDDPPRLLDGTPRAVHYRNTIGRSATAWTRSSSNRARNGAVAAVQPVRFDGQLLAANPLLYNLQLVAASVTPGR